MKRSENTHLPVFVPRPATRASHIPGVGSFGSGFLNDPKELSEKLQKYAISMIDLPCFVCVNKRGNRILFGLFQVAASIFDSDQAGISDFVWIGTSNKV